MSVNTKGGYCFSLRIRSYHRMERTLANLRGEIGLPFSKYSPVKINQFIGKINEHYRH